MKATIDLQDNNLGFEVTERSDGPIISAFGTIDAAHIDLDNGFISIVRDWNSETGQFDTVVRISNHGDATTTIMTKKGVEVYDYLVR